MPDQSCPMCGKFNPADAQVCKYCQARLTPVTPPSSGVSTPDWLKRIRERSRMEDEAELSGAQPPNNETPEWMHGLGEPAQTSEPPPTEPVSQNPPMQDDWLERLRAVSGDVPSLEVDSRLQEESALAEQTGVEGQPPREEPNPNTEFESSAEPSIPLPKPEDEQPSDLQQPAAAEESVDDLVAWLRSLDASGADVEASQPVEQTLGEPGADGLEDQPETIPAAVSEESQSAIEDLPAKLVADSGSTAAEPAAEAGASSDWLTSTLPSANEQPPTESLKEDAAPAELTPAVVDSSTDQPSAQDHPASGDIPDWLQAFRTDETLAEPDIQTPNVESAAFSDQLPSADVFLPEDSEASTSPENTFFTDEKTSAPPEQPDQPSIGEVVPDWLSALETARPGVSYLDGTQSEEPPAEVSPFNDAPALPIGDSPFAGSDLDDWLTHFGQQPVGQTGEPSQEASSFSFGESNPPTAFLPGTTNQLFAEDDLPDWLAQEDAPDKTSSATMAADSGAEGLEPAQLPDWLERMKPLGAGLLTPASVDGELLAEKSGPLAGIQGILTGQEAASQYSRPPVYSIKLHVSEKQRQLVSLFDEMVGKESKAQPPETTHSHTSGRGSRILVAVVVLAALILSMMFAPSKPAAMTIYPAETVAFHKVIQNLSQGAPVFVVFDYEPALSGELRLISSAVIEHLMARQLHLAIASTLPTGPVLANQAIRVANLNLGGQFNSETNVAMLGYLAGSTTSMQEVAVNLLQAAPASRDVLAGWKINRLQDFAAVIVLTDNPDVGRAWIEQIQPSLGSIPLLFVSSAQAAPMLQPYVDGGQVAGLVGGLFDGRAYEQIQKGTGPISALWYVYQTGMGIGMLALLLGILLKIILAILPTRKPRREG